MNITVSAQTGVKSMDEIYSTDLVRDVTYVVFSEFEAANPQIAERCAEVRRHFLDLSNKFPFRRFPLLKTLLRADTVEEIEESVSAQNDLYSRRELDQAMALDSTKEKGWEVPD
jgi:hypothetical protein